MKPKKPIHAESLCIVGLSNVADILAPILCRNEIKVNINRKSVVDASATAINAGAATVGAVKRRLGEFFGRTERSTLHHKLGSPREDFLGRTILW